MTRRPGDREPEPPGGRAAERLREFIEHRFPGREGPPERDAEEHEDERTSEEAGEEPASREEHEEHEGEEHGAGPGPPGSTD